MAARWGGGRLWASPGVLAAGAAACAVMAMLLWALAGLPLGSVVLWLVPLPLFLAGLGFGAGSAWAATGLAAVLLWSTAGGVPLVAYLVLFGLPVPMLVSAAERPGRIDLALPLALLGLWPVAMLLTLTATLPDDLSIEALMRGAIEQAMARMGLAAPDGFVAGFARVKAAAIGGVTALAWIANGRAAQGFLARRGLARAMSPDFAGLRLPFWYPPLPALAAGAYLAAPAESDAVALSALLMLLLPLFLAGLAGVHRRLRGRGGRVAMLLSCYFLLLFFPQIMGPGLVGLGLHDQLRRPASGPRQRPPR